MRPSNQPHPSPSASPRSGSPNEFIEKTIWLCLNFVQEHYDRLALDCKNASAGASRRKLNGKVSLDWLGGLTRQLQLHPCLHLYLCLRVVK